MVEDGGRLQNESSLKWSALSWGIASSFAGGGPTEAALPPERRWRLVQAVKLSDLVSSWTQAQVPALSW